MWGAEVVWLLKEGERSGVMKVQLETAEVDASSYCCCEFGLISLGGSKPDFEECCSCPWRSKCGVCCGLGIFLGLLVAEFELGSVLFTSGIHTNLGKLVEKVLFEIRERVPHCGLAHLLVGLQLLFQVFRFAGSVESWNGRCNGYGLQRISNFRVVRNSSLKPLMSNRFS
ncbi:hypothetical protein Droror1_Dr00025958 [Drosera rotundifolia]